MSVALTERRGELLRKLPRSSTSTPHLLAIQSSSVVVAALRHSSFAKVRTQISANFVSLCGKRILLLQNAASLSVSILDDPALSVAFDALAKQNEISVTASHVSYWFR